MPGFLLLLDSVTQVLHKAQSNQSVEVEVKRAKREDDRMTKESNNQTNCKSE